MADLEHPREVPASGGVLGWLSGLGVVAIPWLVSGIVSTFLPDPEASFAWILLAACGVMLGWIVYGIVRIPRFAKGALIGSAITIGIVLALFLLLRLS